MSERVKSIEGPLMLAAGITLAVGSTLTPVAFILGQDTAGTVGMVDQ